MLVRAQSAMSSDVIAIAPFLLKLLSLRALSSFIYMNDTYFEDQVYDGVNFSAKPLTNGHYEVCSFINCDFSDSDLSTIVFTECEFKGCNLSMVKLAKTTLNDVKFIDGKMLGLNFEDCNELLFSVSFEHCILNFSSFYKRVLKKTPFKNCSLLEADFTEADLTNAVFDHCDLARTKFEHTILEKADFRTAFNYSIDPQLNRIKKARFTQSGIAGLLDRYDIVID